MDEGTERLLRVEEAADRLRLSRSFTWMLIGRGELGTVKLGRRRLVSEAELGRFVDAHRTTGHPPAVAVGGDGT